MESQNLILVIQSYIDEEKKRRNQRKYFGTIALIFSLLFFVLVSCKKDTPPEPVTNFYRMEIAITDNAPFGNAVGFFALTNSTFPDSTDLSGAEGENYLYLSDTPVYLEREINYKALESDTVFLWAISSQSTDNFYSVEVFKNNLSIFQSAGYVISHERIKINP